MDDKNYKRKQININNIFLNVENPRFEKVNSQEEALKVMINEYGDKVFNLAKHISENGMNPTEFSTVIMFENNKYKTLDGNRRLTALKILNNPDLLNQNFEKLKSKIMKLNRKNVPSVINVIKFESEEEAHLWIKLKHTGQNDGIGTVGWDSLQQSRFDNDKYPLSIQLLKYMENTNLFNDFISKNIKDLKITNLERLLSDPDVRDMLSITRAKNKLYFPNPNDDIKNILNNLLKELLSEDFTVNKIRNKPDRIEYINYFKKKYTLTEDKIKNLKKLEVTTVKDYETSKKTEKKISDKKEIKKIPKSSKKDKTIVKTTNESKTYEFPGTKDRSKLIPESFNLSIKNIKINDIYKELKEVSVDKYPNIVGASFRVFLELSIDYYIDKNKIDIGKRDKLKNKLEKVKNHISNTLNLDKNEIKEISRAISSNDNIVSIDVLHGYIHSQISQASPDGLKTTWNNYEHFFELLYEVLNNLPMAIS